LCVGQREVLAAAADLEPVEGFEASPLSELNRVGEQVGCTSRLVCLDIHVEAWWEEALCSS
jgi:hypothetical protein